MAGQSFYLMELQRAQLKEKVSVNAPLLPFPCRVLLLRLRTTPLENVPMPISLPEIVESET